VRRFALSLFSVEVRSSAEAVMPVDVVVSRELKSLQEELSASSENAWHHV
jgi:hypothetical protein